MTVTFTPEQLRGSVTALFAPSADPPTKLPVGRFGDLLARLRAALADTLDAAVTPAELRAATSRLAVRHADCADAIQGGLETAVERLTACLSADPLTADALAEIGLLAGTLAELSERRVADGALGIDLATADAESVRQGGEPARKLVEVLDTEERTFAERLRACLERGGVSQSELADRTGIHPSAVSMMLKRQSRPQHRTVARIAAALGLAPADLWPAAVPPPPRVRLADVLKWIPADWDEAAFAASMDRAAIAMDADPDPYGQEPDADVQTTGAPGQPSASPRRGGGRRSVAG